MDLIPKYNFSKLGFWYIVALSIIAAVIIAGQALMQGFLQTQERDSRVVNVAGRQRMLSQRITQHSLRMTYQTDPVRRTTTGEELMDALTAWKITQEGLIAGNDSMSSFGDANAPPHRITSASARTSRDCPSRR